MKKLVASIICAGIIIPGALAGNNNTNYGGVKIGTCETKTFEFKNLSTHIDEFEITNSNAVLVSVSGTDLNLFTEVSLCATKKGKFDSDLLLKNNGAVITSLHFTANGN